MEDETLNAKLKHIGDSIDKVRDEGRERGKRQEAMAEDITALKVENAGQNARLDHAEKNIAENRNLIWKVLTAIGFLAAGTAGGAQLIEKLF